MGGGSALFLERGVGAEFGVRDSNTSDGGGGGSDDLGRGALGGGLGGGFWGVDLG